MPNRSNTAPLRPRRTCANPLRALRLPTIALIPLALLLSLFGCGPKKATAPRWVVYYGQNAAPEELTGYDVVVVDPNYKGEIAPLRRAGAKVLAYISLGELNASRATFARAQREGLLLEENPNWPGAWLVDVRLPGWRKLVVEERAKELLARGYDGLFLDTLESALHLQTRDAARYAGMQQAAVDLVRALHDRHPGAILLLNGALEVAGALAGAVDRVAVESSLTTWDFAKKAARWRTADERAWAMARAAKARAANPKLTIYTLDYWDPEDRAGLLRIYREQRKAGFVPYAATIALDRVVAEPPAETP